MSPFKRDTQQIQSAVECVNLFMKFFCLPCRAWTRLRLISYKAFAPLAPPVAWLICHTEHAPSECGRRSRLCNLLRCFFFAFISTPSLWLIPDTVLIPPLTREKERERKRARTSVSLNFWATRACLNATEASWQLPHEAHRLQRRIAAACW